MGNTKLRHFIDDITGLFFSYHCVELYNNGGVHVNIFDCSSEDFPQVVAILSEDYNVVSYS